MAPPGSGAMALNVSTPRRRNRPGNYPERKSTAGEETVVIHVEFHDALCTALSAWPQTTCWVLRKLRYCVAAQVISTQLSNPPEASLVPLRSGAMDPVQGEHLH